jgi:hypothetical protein
MTTNDAWWDELGFAWTALEPDPEAATPRLKARLRRQEWRLRLLVAGAALAALLGAALAAWTLWIGYTAHASWFLVRGSAVLAVAVLAALGAAALAGGVKDQTRSLAEALDLAVLRARRSLRAASLAIAACALAAVLGLGGYALRAGSHHPPRMSPIEPLAYLALLALVIFLVRRRLKDDLARTRHLRRSLGD